MRLRGYPPDGIPALSYVGSPTGQVFITEEATSTLTLPVPIETMYTHIT